MGDTPNSRFPRGTERSVTNGRYKGRSREEEEDLPPEGGGAAIERPARSLPRLGSPAQGGSTVPGRKLPRQAGGPRDEGGPEHFGQVGEAVPRARRSRLRAPTQTSRRSSRRTSSNSSVVVPTGASRRLVSSCVERCFCP